MNIYFINQNQWKPLQVFGYTIIKQAREIINLSIDKAAFAIILGICPLIFLPKLPEQKLLFYFLILFLLLNITKNLTCHFLALVSISFLWGCLHAKTLLTQVDFLTQGQKNIVAIVKSVQLQKHHQKNEKPRVLLRIHKLEGKYLFPPIFVSVIWNDHLPSFCSGQKWQLKVRMRAIHSTLNEGGFDSQRWAVANKQPLSGKLISAKPIDLQCDMRQKMISGVKNSINIYDYVRILIALAFGERKLLNKNDWEQLKKTGTAHLIAISGMHIAMAALFGALFARALQFFFPITWIRQGFPLMMSWCSALFYMWLAGASAPTLRAMLALTLWLLLSVFRKKCTAWQVWLWTVSLILIIDPLAILSDSFWLSCFAVAALIFWYQWVPLRLSENRTWYQWLRQLLMKWLHLQLGMMLLLLPIQVALFHGISLSSLIANLWAVPIISFITIPAILLAFLTTFIPFIASIFWFLADFSIGLVFSPLLFLSKGWLSISKAGQLISYSGWLAVIIWRFQFWRSHHIISVVIFCILLWIFTERSEYKRYKWRVDMLDVGHGLAVVIERGGKATIFDTGVRWKTGSMASSVILPYLNWRGLELEHIIISHDHNDHIGGLYELLKFFPKAKVTAPFNPLKKSDLITFSVCSEGNQWEWQELNFEVFWPKKREKNAKNNDSCVIRIDDGQHSLLLSGDLEAKGEYQLIQQAGHKLASTFLQVPHHGSKTSSTLPFLRAVKPTFAFASVSRYNQWHLPAQKIIKRYQKNHILWRDTSVSGQLTVFFFDKTWKIRGYREEFMPRWYHQPLGVFKHQ
ncbi:ComEC family protein [Candidatus Hamiltonella defensa]|uniref:ComEC family protein n=1 Tax=Candidatus Williamhamiltonella defendens TaxID=138072 RepID=UPI001F478C0B|nr:ComEC family protein [Candidatus Hamiltonella defensa]